MAKGETNDGLPDVDIEVLMDQADSAADKMAAALGALQKTTSRVKAIRGRKTSADVADAPAATDSNQAAADSEEPRTDPQTSEPTSDTPSTPPENVETAQEPVDEKSEEDRPPESAGEDASSSPGDKISDEEKQESGLLVSGGSLEQTELAVEIVDELMDEVVRQVEPADSETESPSQSEEALNPSPPQTETADSPAEQSLESAALDAESRSDVDGPPADPESTANTPDETLAEETEESESASTQPTPDQASSMSETSGENTPVDSETDQAGDEESVIDVAEAALAATESLIKDIESKENPATPADSATADSSQDNIEEGHSPDASIEKESDSGDAMDAMDEMEALVGGLEEESKANEPDEADVDGGASDKSDKSDPIDDALSSMEDLIENLDQGQAPEQPSEPASEQTDNKPDPPTPEGEEPPVESDQKAATFEEFDRDQPGAPASDGETVSSDAVLKASPAPDETSSETTEKPPSDQEIDADSVLADMEALVADATSDSTSSAPAPERKDDTTAGGRKPESDETPSDGGDQSARQDVPSDGDAISIGNVTEAETTGLGKPDEVEQAPESVEEEQTFHSLDSTEGLDTGNKKGTPDGDADESEAAPSEPKVSLGQRTAHFCLRIVHRIFQTLDAPFSGMQGRWKTMAGYLALGTLFMALTAWVVSSFGNFK